jgi:hypothetical protein
MDAEEIRRKKQRYNAVNGFIIYNYKGNDINNLCMADTSSSPLVLFS